ncbi:MAG: hypothetical protein LBB47_01830 [Spirochaetaceae bacterium]|nr:hypothetical protein [Spirochaetaceae bacterium]
MMGSKELARLAVIKGTLDGDYTAKHEEQLAGNTLDKTQFGHIAETLGCDLIPTGSWQAKGGS